MKLQCTVVTLLASAVNVYAMADQFVSDGEGFHFDGHVSNGACFPINGCANDHLHCHNVGHSFCTRCTDQASVGVFCEESANVVSITSKKVNGLIDALASSTARQTMQLPSGILEVAQTLVIQHDLMIVGSSDANMPTELVFTDGAKGIEFDVRERVVFDHGVSLRSEGASQEHYCTFQAPLNDTVIYFDNLAPEMVGDEQVRIGLYTWPLYDQRTIKDITLGQCTLTTHPHVFDETRVLVDVEDMCKYKISAVINLEFIQECKLPLRKMGSEMSHVASWSVVFTEYFDSDSEGRALNTPISRDMEYDGETIINVDQDTGASIVDVQQNKYDTSTLQTLTVLSHAWIVNDVDTEDLGVKLVVRVPEPFHMSNHSDGAVRQFVDADGNPITSTGLTQQQVIDQLIDRQQAAANKAATNAADHTNDTAPINQDQLYEMIAHPPAPENEPVVFPSTYPRPSPNNYNIQQGEPLTPEQIQTIKDHLLNRIKSVTNDVNDTVPESRTDSSTVVIPVGEKGKIAITAQVDKPAGAVGSEGSIKPHIDVTGQVHKPAPGDDSDGTTKPHIDISATLGIEKTKTERRQAQGTTDTVQVTQYSGIGSFMVDIWKKRGGSTRVGQAEIFEDCQINEETKGCEQQVNVKLDSGCYAAQQYILKEVPITCPEAYIKLGICPTGVLKKDLNFDMPEMACETTESTDVLIRSVDFYTTADTDQRDATAPYIVGESMIVHVPVETLSQDRLISQVKLEYFNICGDRNIVGSVAQDFKTLTTQMGVLTLTIPVEERMKCDMTPDHLGHITSDASVGVKVTYDQQAQGDVECMCTLDARTSKDISFVVQAAVPNVPIMPSVNQNDTPVTSQETVDSSPEEIADGHATAPQPQATLNHHSYVDATEATADTSANSNTDSSSQDNGVGVAGVVSICLALLLVVLLVGSGIYFYRSRKARSIKQEVMDFSRSPSMQSNADSRHAFGDTDEMSTSNVTSAITMVDKAGDMCDERMKV